jgi:hypothetical protein
MLKWASKDAQDAYWWARRYLGIRDHQEAPGVDEAIRLELEMHPIDQMSIRRIKARLQID